MSEHSRNTIGLKGLLLRDVLIYGAAKIVPGAIGLASVALFVRTIGAAEFGRVAILSMTVAVLSSFCGGWFYQGVLRFYSTWSAPREYWRLFLARGFAASFTAFVFVIGAFHTALGQETLTEILLCTALGAGIIIQTVLLSCWQSDLQPFTVVRVEMIRAVASLLITILLFYLIAANAAAVIAGAAVGYIASLFGGAKLLHLRQSAGATLPTLRQAFLFGAPLSLWFLLQLSFPWVDRIMIEKRYGLETTGVYASLWEVLTRIYSLLIYPITVAIYPRLTKLWAAGERSTAHRLLRFSVAGSIGISLISLIVICAMQRIAIEFILPRESQHLALQQPYLVTLIAAGGAVWQLALLAHKPLELASDTRTMLTVVGLALAAKILFNIVFLEGYGISAAAAGSVLSGLLYCFGSAHAARDRSIENS